MSEYREACALCLHPHSEHFEADGTPDHCCDGCDGYVTLKEFNNNPQFWSISDRDGQTILDGSNRVVTADNIMAKFKDWHAQLRTLTEQLEAAEAILSDIFHNYEAGRGIDAMILAHRTKYLTNET